MPSPDEVRDAIAASRKRSLNFAVICSNDPKDCVLLTHKSRPPKSLFDKAKKEAKPKFYAFGTFATEGKILTLVTEKPPQGQVGKNLKKYLTTVVGLNGMKVIVQDADGGLLEDDEEDEAEAAASGAATAAPSVDPQGAADDGVQDEKADDADDAARDLWLAAQKRYGETVRALARDTEFGNAEFDGSKLGAAWGLAEERADKKKFAEAVKIVRWILAKTDRLQGAAHAAAPQPEQDAGTNGPSAGTGETAPVDPAVIRDAFVKIDTELPAKIAAVSKEVEKLRGEIETSCKGAPGFTKIGTAFDKLSKRIDNIGGTIAIVTKKGVSEPNGKALRQMRDLVDKASGILASDPVLSNLDSNPFVDVAVQARLQAALADIRAQLPS